MQAEAAATRCAYPPIPLTVAETIHMGRRAMLTEANTLLRVARRLDENFHRAASLICGTRGKLVVCGMGKAGLVGQKISATFASTGTPSIDLHPSDAVHGDLGRIEPEDTALLLTHSGETPELLSILPSLAAAGVPVVAITGCDSNSTAKAADVVLALGPLVEACTLGLAPTSSTTAMLAVGDALAITVCRLKGFMPEDFARFHPGGNLGHKLRHVEEVMRPRECCRVADDHQSVRSVLVGCSKSGRRSGAVMLTDSQGKLTGIFTDSDLARLLESRHEEALDAPIQNAMTTEPLTVSAGSFLADAQNVMAQHKISELPVVDAQGHPVGMLDVTDLVGAERDTSGGDAEVDDLPPNLPHVRLFTEPTDENVAS